MKKFNEYRKAEHFNIMGTTLAYLVEVSKFVPTIPNVKHLVGIVPAIEGFTDDRIDLFTVRVTTTNQSIYDLLIEASTHKPCVVLDRVLISGTPDLMK